MPQLVADAFLATRTGGRCVMVGSPPAGEPIPLDGRALFSERRLLGTTGGSNVPARDIPRIAALYQEGRLDLDTLVSARSAIARLRGVDRRDRTRRGRVERCHHGVVMIRGLTGPNVIVMRSPVERAMRLEYLTVGWNTFEVFVTIALGVASGSLALVAFGLDSLVEIFASGAVLWQLHRGGVATPRAMAMVGGAFLVLGVLLIATAVIALASEHQADDSPVGIAYLAVTVCVMFVLARQKRRARRHARQPSVGDGSPSHVSRRRPRDERSRCSRRQRGRGRVVGRSSGRSHRRRRCAEGRHRRLA